MGASSARNFLAFVDRGTEEYPHFQGNECGVKEHSLQSKATASANRGIGTSTSRGGAQEGVGCRAKGPERRAR